LLEDRDPRRPVPLVERRLRLERGDAPAERVDVTPAERPQPRDVVAEPPALQERRVRVDPDAQRPVGGHRRCEPAPERGRRDAADRPAVVRRAHRAARSASCSWRERTVNGPERTASIAWTAAASCWTVVM